MRLYRLWLRWLHKREEQEAELRSEARAISMFKLLHVDDCKHPNIVRVRALSYPYFLAPESGMMMWQCSTCAMTMSLGVA